MPHTTRLRCIACGAESPVERPLTSCPACGDLLEVVHDLSAHGRSGADWRALFDSRRAAYPGVSPVDASGVWRFRELVFPPLAPEEVVTKPEGATRLYRVRALGAELGLPRLHVKHEGENPTLSFKDRGMTVGVSWAKKLGIREVVCASTGDTSAALAAYAAEVPGMRAVVLLPDGKVTGEQLSQALHYGATTLALDTDFDGCMRVVRQLAERRDVMLLNSKNPVRLEGQKTIGWEIVQDLGWEVPDWLAVPVGNAGNVSAIGKGMREWRELGIVARTPRFLAAQADAADPFYRSFETGFAERITRVAGETAASAIRIGAPVSHDKAARVVKETGGAVVRVTEEELLDAFARANRHGIALCPNSAVALAGAAKARRAGLLAEDALVVVVATAHALKFSGTAAAYHASDRPLANRPRRIAATVEAVEAALATLSGS